MLEERILTDVFGEVLSGRDRRTGGTVTLRAFAPGLPIPEARVEAVRALQVSHPGLAPILDLVQDEGRWFLVSEAVHGTLLRDRVARTGPRSREAALQLGLRIGEALHALHRAGGYHGRLDPTRVVCSGERVTIVDVGLGMLLGDDSDESRTTIPDASDANVAFLSPEQASGEGEPTIESDVWAFGALLHFLVFGAPPYEASSRAKLSIATTKGVSLAEALDQRVRDLIAACLSREPALRPTIGEVIEQLRTVVQPSSPSLPVGASSEPGSTPGTALSVFDPPPMHRPRTHHVLALLVPLLVLGYALTRREAAPRAASVGVDAPRSPASIALPELEELPAPSAAPAASPAPSTSSRPQPKKPKRASNGEPRPADSFYGINSAGF